MSVFFPPWRVILVVLMALLVAACSAQNGTGESGDAIYDPYEETNRNIHAFNRGLDRAIVRPVGVGITTILPDEVEDSIGNFATNLGQPKVMVNSLLQGDLRGLGISTVRFLTNSTLGLFGLFDVASELNVPQHDADFGQTLYVWGVKEGAYIEVPVLGPSTQRALTGKVVDLILDPLGYYADSPEKYYETVSSVTSSLSDRGRYAETIDSVLYESADSYAQARLIYLQNRRFELGDEGSGDEIDPFALDTEGF